MIYTILHNKKTLTAVLDDQGNKVDIKFSSNPVVDLFQFCKEKDKSVIIWCNEKLYDFIDYNNLLKELNHSRLMISYSTSGQYFLNERIGFVDQTIFLKINRKVIYPTWLMSSDIGAINSDTLIAFDELSKTIKNLDELFCTIAKVGQPKGLISRSVPGLIKEESHLSIDQRASNSRLYDFVKKNYSFKWNLLLFLNTFLYEKKFHLFHLLRSILIPKINIEINLPNVKITDKGLSIVKKDFTVDVIIPTLKRKPYLYDVLKDLSNQTILPKKVIVIEQDPNQQGESELDYLKKETWPFEIVHEFIHQLGACNARNLALSKVSNNWVFFADDDVRFDKDLFEKVLRDIQKYNSETCMFSCPLKGETINSDIAVQSTIFGSGTIFVKSDCLKGVKFKMEHEFGYGEDLDFGMQLRNKGTDILFFPETSMTHLKAPTGGFRYDHNFAWSEEVLQPKPSPTVMTYKLKHSTKYQLWAYKTTFFINLYKSQSVKNPFRFLSETRSKWRMSEKWALKMLRNEI